MSQENVGIVENVIAAWNQRDLDAILSVTDPQVEYVNAPMAVEPGIRHGHAELSEVFRKQWEGLGSDARQEIERVHVQDDAVITASRMARRMPGSDTQIENRIALRWTLREGRLIRLEVLGAGSSFKDALKAAGLRE